MYDLRRNGEEQPGNEAAAGPAPGKRAPTDRLDVRPAAGLVAPPMPPAFAGHANHVEDPARDPNAVFANDDPFGFHLLGPKRVTTGVNVRSAPKVADDNRVGGYDAGDIINVIARQGEWALIMHNGHPAYVHGKYLEDPPAVAAAPKAAAPNAAAPKAPAPKAPAAVVQPFVDHSFDQLVTLARASGPQPSVLADELLAAAALQKRAARGGVSKAEVGANEELGKDRAELVKAIAHLRAGITALPDELASLKGGFFRAVQDIAPYYQQWNTDLIDKQTFGFTCNITSLSMALESLGKTSADFKPKGGDEKLLVAAKAINGMTTREALAGLRLPDFMQIAVVANFMKSPSSDAVKAAKAEGREALKDPGLQEELARQFGATAKTEGHGFGSALRHEGDQFEGKDFRNHRRKRVLGLAHLRRTNQKEYERRHAAEESLLHSQNIEKDVKLSAYQSWIQTTVGGELSSGAAIIMGMGGAWGHFARLQAIHEDHIVIDDPGELVRRDLKLTYDEARAIGGFCNRIVVRG